MAAALAISRVACSGAWSWFLTANYLENDVGIENPTSSRKPIHDHTNQVKAFGKKETPPHNPKEPGGLGPEVKP